jgi:magnesium-transporting ATPase (P-type)
VLCKGADSILFPLLNPKKTKEQLEVEAKTNQFLEDYSKEGLRTLLLIEKVKGMSTKYCIDDEQQRLRCMECQVPGG